MTITLERPSNTSKSPYYWAQLPSPLTSTNSKSEARFSPPTYRPSIGTIRCSRCRRPKLMWEMARKDAKHLRSYCKDCDTYRKTGVNKVALRGIAIPGLADALAAHPYSETGAETSSVLDIPNISIRQPTSTEMRRPRGQAACWYTDVKRNIDSYTAVAVAYQIARLCGDDSEVLTSTRRLADAVGLRDSAGRLKSFTETGVATLKRNGWLETTDVGIGTTYSLTVGTL